MYVYNNVDAGSREVTDNQLQNLKNMPQIAETSLRQAIKKKSSCSDFYIYMQLQTSWGRVAYFCTHA